MAADEDTEDAVRRILKERPPEDLPSGAEARLRQRLNAERPAKTVERPAKPKAKRPKKTKAVR